MCHGGTASTNSAEATLLFDFRSSRNCGGFCGSSTSASATVVSTAALRFLSLRLRQDLSVHQNLNLRQCLSLHQDLNIRSEADSEPPPPPGPGPPQ